MMTTYTITRKSTGETFHADAFRVTEALEKINTKLIASLEVSRTDGQKVNTVTWKQNDAGNFVITDGKGTWVFDAMVKFYKPAVNTAPTLRNPDAPATKAQLDYLAKLKKVTGPNMHAMWVKPNMTMAQASHAIEMLKDTAQW
jgi:hypothetical protein